MKRNMGFRPSENGFRRPEKTKGAFLRPEHTDKQLVIAWCLSAAAHISEQSYKPHKGNSLNSKLRRNRILSSHTANSNKLFKCGRRADFKPSLHDIGRATKCRLKIIKCFQTAFEDSAYLLRRRHTVLQQQVIDYAFLGRAAGLFVAYEKSVAFAVKIGFDQIADRPGKFAVAERA